MSSAIFVVPITVGVGPIVPDVLWEDTDPKRGYSCLGQVPSAETCLVRIWATEDCLDAIAADPDCLFVEDVVEVPDVA